MKPHDVVPLIVVGMNRSGAGFNHCQFLIEMRRMVDTNCKGGDASGTNMVHNKWYSIVAARETSSILQLGGINSIFLAVHLNLNLEHPEKYNLYYPLNM